MIKKVIITNHLDESLELELTRPEKTGLVITGIDGLGASDATINVDNLSMLDGGIFNSARVNARNINFNFKFLFTPTIEDVRLKTYKYFPIKKKIKMRFITDNHDAEIAGYVESNDPTVFSKAEGTSINVVCPDPYFYSVKDDITLFSGIEAEFEFPMENDSLDEALMCLGDYVRDPMKTIYYFGAGDVGVIINIHAVGPVKNITVNNVDTRESIKVDLELKAGDQVIISTVKGDKYARLIREGEETNILNRLGRNIGWFTLKSGENTFHYTAEDGVDNVVFQMENKVAYEGI